MSAGTIALTQNSTAVTGTNTAFTTDLKPGDFIVATVGGTAYTLGVLSITSNTALVLSQAYQGATTSGLSWQAVPFATLNLISSALAAQVSYAVRGFNLDKNNWQQIFSGTGNVTVTLPDGTSWTGPAWNGIATAITNKADLVSGAVPITQGGTGAKTAATAWAALASYGTSAGTAAQGNDTRFVNFTVTASPKNIVVSNSFRWDVPAGLICHGGANSASRTSVFTVDWTSGGGTHIFIDSTDMGQVQFITSDERLKTKIQPATSGFVERVKSQEVVEYEWVDKKMRGSNRLRGFIAQRVGKVDPMLMNGSEEGQYGLEIIGLLADAYGAIQEQQSFIESQAAELNELKSRMKAIDGLDA